MPNQDKLTEEDYIQEDSKSRRHNRRARIEQK